MDSGVGIYKITLASFPKERILYVGQSKYLTERIRSHKKTLRSGNHHNPHLQNIYNKHHFSGVRFEVVCQCRVSDLDTLEQMYIDNLKPECNIILDLKNPHAKRVEPVEPSLLSIEIPGLELDWTPKDWHVWVYGCGRRGF